MNSELIKPELNFYQMSDELYDALCEYLKKYNLSFSRYCQDLKVEEYMMRKVVDRKIGMYAPYKLLKKIAKSIQREDLPLWQDPFQMKRIKKRTTF